MDHSSQPPNVLYVVVDDHQHDAIGAAGNPDVKTPVLDALVREGTWIRHARTMGGCSAAVCSPARACLLTGAHTLRAGRVDRNNTTMVAIDPALQTLPECFRKAGYETFLTGKWHNDEAALVRSFEMGKRIFCGGMSDHTAVPVRDLAEVIAGAPAQVGTGFSTELFCDSLLCFLRARDRRRPFFAWLSLTSPHDPRTPPHGFQESYSAESLTLPPAVRPMPAFDNGELNIRDETLLPKPIQEGALRHEMAAYYGMISHHDSQLGLIIEELQRTGQRDNTIIVYVSDHGLALGRHGLLGKQNLYDHSIRVPLVIAGPGIPRDREFDGLAFAHDTFATLCAATGVPQPPGTDSINLLPAIRGTTHQGRSSVFSLYRNCQRTVVVDGWKLIAYQVNGRERLQLFHLDSDPAELCDVSSRPEVAHRLRELLGVLETWQVSVGDGEMRLSSGRITEQVPPWNRFG